jgi:hypothetical protein
VTVGDAAATRLYKDGIGSAFHTTKTASSVAIQLGISARAFRKNYAPLCHSLAQDNSYGFLLFRLWNFVLHTPFLLNAWKGAIQQEMSLPVKDRVHIRVLWGMLTGDEPYRMLFARGINPISLIRLGRGMRLTRKGG